MTQVTDWRGLYDRLRALPSTSSVARKQSRGYEFQRVLEAMFRDAHMEPGRPYRPRGEEIDGSFIYRGRTMLYEAKWTSEPVPASALYQFRGKLDGKLAGTLGVFFSIGGDADDAVDALVAGKELNLVLFDGDDMDKLAAPRCISIKRAIDIKLRVAAERGTPFIPLPPCARVQGLAAPLSVVVVEGPYDAAIIRGLYRAVEDVPPMPLIVVAMGHLNLPHVALAQLSLLPELRRVIVVADGDGDIAEVSQPVYDEFSGSPLTHRAEIIVIVVNPSLEAALGIARRQVSPDQIALEIRYENIRARAAENDGLRQLLEVLGLFE